MQTETKILYHLFKELILRYHSDEASTELLWNEIVNHYTDKKRHYHTLSHLMKLTESLSEIREQINDWDAILFSVFYHDIIYSSTAKDNEEQSAMFASDRLKKIQFPPIQIQKVCQAILATRTHEISNDSDINFFTDAVLTWQFLALTKFTTKYTINK